MTRLRHLISRHHSAAIVLVALALFMKSAVPVGFMPDTSSGRIRLVMCSGYGPERITTMAMPGMPGMERHDDTGGREHKEMPCGFSGHAPGSIAMADPVVLAIAIAFIVATVFRIEAAPVFPAPQYLRPHPRGPPAIG